MMQAIRQVLVAVKELRAARPLVYKAAQIASANGAALELFHCLSEPIVLDYAFDENRNLNSLQRAQRDRALHQLERIAAAVRRQHTQLKITLAAEWDAPAYDGIVRRARKIKADLIVASRHSGPHMLPSIMRLTDWELVRLSPVPLLLVSKATPYHRPAVLVAVDPTHAFAKPLQFDRTLLRQATALSQSLHGSLHAVHAYARIPAGALPPNGLGITHHELKRIQTDAQQTAKAGLERALKGTLVKTANRHLIGSHPVDAILQAARTSHSAIVVMGAVSRSGLKRLLIGNTAERILDELTCDVLVVKPRAFKSRVPRRVQGPRVWMPTLSPWSGSY